MDFRNVTDLFADPDFDGDPVMIKEVSGNDELTDDDIFPDDDIIDPDSGDIIDFDVDVLTDPQIPTIIDGGDITDDDKGKVYIAGVDVSILNERVQHLDANGKLITESLKEYTRKGIRREYRSLEEFLTKWNTVEKKQSIISELESHGIILENLMEEVKKELDVFDLICHVAWDMPALTRKERVEQVKKRNYFTKYGEQARKILNALLDKYASAGIENIEELSILKIDPFNVMGTPSEIIAVFGGKENYLKAIKELEQEIYKVAA
jgi:type I restriction enzyme R subunit